MPIIHRVSLKQIAAHIKTRDEHAIRSHVQKYFIKLFRDGLPLPAKVIESGTGYTLSGKELDPESAAARPYLKGKWAGNSITTPGLDKENAVNEPEYVDKQGDGVMLPASDVPLSKPLG
jgi:hypothetical protein